MIIQSLIAVTAFNIKEFIEDLDDKEQKEKMTYFCDVFIKTVFRHL